MASTLATASLAFSLLLSGFTEYGTVGSSLWTAYSLMFLGQYEP